MNSIHILKLGTLPFVIAAQCATYSVGEYLKLSAVGAGTLTSPNYPSKYTDRDHAVWLLEAPSGQAVRLDIAPVSGQGGEQGYVNITGCKDYLEVRSGINVWAYIIRFRGHHNCGFSEVEALGK